MKTDNDTLRTDNRTITTLVILIAILIVILIAPPVFTWLKGEWDYHMNYVTEDEIADYVKAYLEEDTSVCLGQTTVNDQIVTWWRTGETLGKIRVLNFKKERDKYYLYRDKSPSQESFGYSQSFPGCYAILITAENCVRFSYILDETQDTVPVDSVPFAYCFPDIPADLVPHIQG